MVNKQEMASLEQVLREALTLRDDERANGGVEDEQKWAALSEKAEIHMQAIEADLAQREEHFTVLEQAMDVALEMDDTANIGAVIGEMMRMFD